MSEISRINKIVDQLVLSLESIVKYAQFSNTDNDESGKNSNHSNYNDDSDAESDTDDFYTNQQQQQQQQAQQQIQEQQQQANKDFEEISKSPVNDSTQGIVLIHTRAQKLVSGIQELLLITRNLRERWVVGEAVAYMKFAKKNEQIPTTTGNAPKDENNDDEMIDSIEQKTQLLAKSIDELLKK